MSKKLKIEQQANSGVSQYGVYCGTGYNATWGGGHDIHLSDNCNTVNSSYSNLGHTYVCPSGMINGSEEAKNYLAGSYNFLVNEIEAFKFISTD